MSSYLVGKEKKFVVVNGFSTGKDNNGKNHLFIPLFYHNIYKKNNIIKGQVQLLSVNNLLKFFVCSVIDNECKYGRQQ